MRTRGVAVAAVLLLAAGACGGGSHDAVSVTPHVAPVQIARLMIATPALTSPTGTAASRLATTVRPGGGPTRLLVVGHRTVAGHDWLRVLLANRPNGSTGWIPRDRARITTTAWAVVVPLAERRLYAVRRGRVVRRFSVVVGRQQTPTPTGRFAISERIALGSSGGFYGTWMLTLTAHSEVLDTFEGGDGQVAIHGRGGASLEVPVGTAGSNGCVRMRNRDIDWLAKHVSAGTPVIVVSSALK